VTLSDCSTLFQHAEWADALVWNVALSVGQEDADLKERLYHVHVVQWAYLWVWRGEPIAPPAIDTFASLGAVRDWARRFYQELPSYLAGLPVDSAEREVRLPWADRLVERFGTARPATWVETVLQVNLHGTYHRGQVNTRLRALGAEPPLTDFIAWVWMGRPAPSWVNHAA
jgi:uncharacterized damage-inducible protein DinB